MRDGKIAEELVASHCDHSVQLEMANVTAEEGERGGKKRREESKMMLAVAFFEQLSYLTPQHRHATKALNTTFQSSRQVPFFIVSFVLYSSHSSAQQLFFGHLFK